MKGKNLNLMGGYSSIAVRRVITGRSFDDAVQAGQCWVCCGKNRQARHT